MLHQRFGIPVRLGNDANCAALAEVVAGAAVGCQDMVLITLGTGVGSGIISRGKILSGLRGGAGEAGHMLLVLDGEPCTCGRRGCFETYASATAIIRGAGKITLGGKTGNATYKLNGVGVIDAESLKADNVRSDRAGIGSIRY